MLGIDIGNYSLKVVSVKRNGRRASIDYLAYEVLPENFRGGNVPLSSLQKIISHLIQKSGIKPQRVALSIPTSSTILKTIEVDRDLPEELLEGEVQMALMDFVPFPLEQVYVDFVRLENSRDDVKKQEVFVVASHRDAVDKVASTVDLKSVRRKEVDVEAFALGKVLDQIKNQQYQKTYAIVDIGYRSSVITIFSAGEMLFSREQPIGGQHLTESIAELEGISLSEAEKKKCYQTLSISPTITTAYLGLLSEQIRLSLDVFYGGEKIAPISMVYLTGGGSMVSDLPKFLQQDFPNMSFRKLPIGHDIPIGRHVYGEVGEALEYSSAVACGLALRD